MKIEITKTNYRLEADALIVPIFVDDAQALTRIDELTGGALRAELVKGEFNAELGQRIIVKGEDKVKAKNVILLGLGEKNTYRLETLRRLAGEINKMANENNFSRVAIESPSGKVKSAQAIAEGLWLSDYRFNKYKSTSEAPKLKQVMIFFEEPDVKHERALQNAAIAVLGTTLARDLVNEPSNKMGPDEIVQLAREIEMSSSQINARIFTKKELEADGFGAILAVSAGSYTKPYLIHLIYKPSKNKAKKKIALLGKGITFDSGGISLKPADKMADMKADMAGAATLLGLFRVLPILDLPIEIHAVLPVCENLPSNRATKPGDVIRAYNGKTIEILNTDAEGRLILADGLSYISKQIMPQAIIELSTLTGACLVALGENIAAIMSNSVKLKRDLMKASYCCGEKLWPLPLESDYKKKMESNIADIKNITADRWGGAIMGGLFLAEFVPHEIEFAHIDIAGPSFFEKSNISYIPSGGSGYGVRLLLEYLKIIS
ncbi:leucyl aminopeptidase [Patescibacteria group bacterium]|nr:leucyl aminopeptidase [Patescibacteria group bacterium]